MPACASFASFESESVLFSVLKKSERGSCTVIRGVEYSGIAQTARVRYADTDYELDIAPYEIFTAAIDNCGIKKVDMLEDILI